MSTSRYFIIMLVASTLIFILLLFAIIRIVKRSQLQKNESPTQSLPETPQTARKNIRIAGWVFMLYSLFSIVLLYFAGKKFEISVFNYIGLALLSVAGFLMLLTKSFQIIKVCCFILLIGAIAGAVAKIYTFVDMGFSNLKISTIIFGLAIPLALIGLVLKAWTSARFLAQRPQDIFLENLGKEPLES